MLIEKRKDLYRQKGFTLIELLVVIVIIGLLASFVGPRLFGKVEKSKIQAARFQIEQLGTTLELYRLDIGRFPGNLEELLRSSHAKWKGPYLEKKLIPLDPWGDEYTYQVLDGGKAYRISSRAGGSEIIKSWE